MFDAQRIARFIAQRRKSLGLTQRQVAQALNVSFQAVSKWETGVTCPNTESLMDLASLLGVTADELLSGRARDEDSLTYSKAGVDITYTDSIKREMAAYIGSGDRRVLSRPGAFAALYDMCFDGIDEPVLVLKAEEPGSKQKLAFHYGYTESICHDLVNHLVNGIVVMGAKPLAVLDTIICAAAEKDTVTSLVRGISEACRVNECTLVGGETSIQPGVAEKGMYMLTASIAGVVEKRAIIDGSRIAEGDAVLAIASNGLHTNGYSLVRLLIERMPRILTEAIGNKTFLQRIMEPHTAYYPALKSILGDSALKGLAHITGGGIEGNLRRIIPDGLCAQLDLSRLKIPAIFDHIRQNGAISDSEMLSTFNCGAGMIAVVSPPDAARLIGHISKHHRCYPLGSIIKGPSRVSLTGRIGWR